MLNKGDNVIINEIKKGTILDVSSFDHNATYYLILSQGGRFWENETCVKLDIEFIRNSKIEILIDENGDI